MLTMKITITEDKNKKGRRVSKTRRPFLSESLIKRIFGFHRLFQNTIYKIYRLIRF